MHYPARSDRINLHTSRTPSCNLPVMPLLDTGRSSGGKRRVPHNVNRTLVVSHGKAPYGTVKNYKSCARRGQTNIRKENDGCYKQKNRLSSLPSTYWAIHQNNKSGTLYIDVMTDCFSNLASIYTNRMKSSNNNSHSFLRALDRKLLRINNSTHQQRPAIYVQTFRRFIHTIWHWSDNHHWITSANKLTQ